jgi:hypothetical protein
VRSGNDAARVVTRSDTRAAFGNYTPRQWPQLGDYTGFVRVRRRTLKGGHPDWREYRRRHGCLHTTSCSFDLVQAVRLNGKPRQRFLLGLGSIKDSEREGRLVNFWLQVIFRLGKSGFKPKRRRLILAQMARKGAPLPSVAACNEFGP